ncbi:MAG TPA: GGDEF domain-containing protein [Solirubrobacteraceae bacterium]|nr:GGDEF domain-containing protein [Solirubrobacteraceae bacterium]
MSMSNQRPRRPAAALAAMWLLVAFHGVHALIGFGGAELRWLCNTWIYTATEGLAVAVCIGRVVTERRDRLAWALIAFGVLTWSCGDLVWTLWLDDLRNPPFPSIADPLYLAMYPAMYVGFVLLIRAERGRFRVEQWLDGVVVGLAPAALGAGLILPTVLHESQGRFLDDVINLAYPLGDLLLLVFVGVSFALSSWRPDRRWAFLGAAMIVSGIADLVFTYAEAKGTYVAGGILDTGWPAAMALVATASCQPARARRTEEAPVGFSEIVLPAAFVLLALVLLVDAAFVHVTPAAVALAAATLVVGTARAILTFMDNVRMLRQHAEDAVTDGLTGLGNRRRLIADLDAAVAAGPDRPRTLVFFDLNGFKRYNDTLGHGAGDALLARLGAALEAAVGEHGRAYRLGGDEFCALLEGRFGLVAAATEALTERHALADISAAVGLAIAPEEAATTTGILALADQRMYAAKVERRGDTAAFTHQVLMQVLSERSAELEGHVSGVGQLVRDLGQEFASPEPRSPSARGSSPSATRSRR